MSIGQRIRWARDLTGLTQAQLAERAGFGSKMMVSHWETDRHVPTVASLVAIARVLRVSIDWLVEAEGQQDEGSSPKPDTTLLTR